MTKKELKDRIEKWKPGAEIKVRVEESPSRPGGRWVISATSEEACFPAEREGYKRAFSNILARSLTRQGADMRAAKIARWIKEMYLGSGVGSYGPPRDFAAETERMFEKRTDGQVRPMMPPLEGAEPSKLFADVREHPEVWTDALLYKLARKNPVVYHFLQLRARADLTHEQALVGLILYLSEEKRRLIEQVTDFYMKFPGPLPFLEVKKATAEGAETEKEKENETENGLAEGG